MTTPRAPWLVLAWGNPGRGDDALGARLIERLQAEGLDADGRVELLWDFQLQVEHVLDLAGRQAVLLADAHRGLAQCTLEPLAPAGARMPVFSHALAPEALLALTRQLHPQATPPAWLLAMPAEAFELGAPLGARAEAALQAATHLVRHWTWRRLQAADAA